MPKLVRLYIRQVMIGFAIAALFVAMLLGLNVMELRSLIFGSDSGLLALFLLWFMNGIVFAGVQFAWAVMAMAEPEDRGPRGGTPELLEFRPIPVRVDKPRRPF